MLMLQQTAWERNSLPGNKYLWQWWQVEGSM